MSVPESWSIDVPELLQNLFDAQGVIIDVRSPSEFAEAAVPFARNWPLLDDRERVEVGTIYKKQGSKPARDLGFQLVLPKLGDLCSRILNRHEPESVLQRHADTVAGILWSNSISSQEKSSTKLAPSNPKNIFYCWRGGARSQSVCAFARLLGIEAYFLKGGHKAYRREVLRFFSEEFRTPLLTVYGLTGAGKTKLLQKWQSEQKPVIDLEGLAHHRGSAFGQIGIDELGRQAAFENKLFFEIQRLLHKKAPFIVVEGESQRVGRCRIPDSFFNAMLGGRRVRLECPVGQRVQNLMEDYVRPLDENRLLAEAAKSLDSIKKRLGGALYKELNDLLAQRKFHQFTERLLLDYYDKMYANSRAPESSYGAVIEHPQQGWAVIEQLMRPTTPHRAPSQ